MADHDTHIQESPSRVRTYGGERRQRTPLRDGNAIVVGERGTPDIDSLREAFKADPKRATSLIGELTHLRDEQGNPVPEHKRLTFNNVRSIKRVQDVLEEVRIEAFDRGQKRAISTSAFPVLISAMIKAGVNEPYMAVETITQDLVTDLNDVGKITVYDNILGADVGVDEVKELDNYPEIGASEEKYQIGHKRNGRKVSISQEMIEEDRLGVIVNRLNALGTLTPKLLEKQGLRRIFDLDGSGASPAEPYVLHRNGVAVSLYVTSAATLTRLPTINGVAGNRIENNPLTDAAALEKARARLARMKDPQGYPIATSVSQYKLVVPDASVDTALKILNSEYTPGLENEVSNWGPRGRYRPQLRSSTFIDEFVGTQTWLMGLFEAQFIRKWKQMPEITVMSGKGTQVYLDSRTGYQASVGWDMEIGATDYVFVVQNLDGTTPPTGSSS